MVRREILRELIPITDEEQEFLDGRKVIDRSLYMSEKENVINSSKLLKQGKLINIRPHTRFVHFPEHTHDYVEMVYMCSGSTTHIVNGKKIFLEEGELLLLSQNARQEILEAGGNDIAVNFIILPEFFDSTLGMLGEEDTPLKRFVVDCLCRKNDSPEYMHFKVKDVLPIQNLIENLLWTLIYDIPNKRSINQTTMGLLFLYLINNTDALIYDNENEEAIMKVLKYIETNYRNSSLTQAANFLHYDLYWLSREIKKKTGKTYTEILQEKRMSQSAFLLKNTDYKISDIALAVGYDNISYFYRLFSKTYGVSPKNYRARK